MVWETRREKNGKNDKQTDKLDKTRVADTRTVSPLSLGYPISVFFLIFYINSIDIISFSSRIIIRH